VTAAATATTVIVPWNDGEAVAKACAEHEFAAILAEPYPANMGLVLPDAGVPVSITSAPGLLTVFFAERAPRDYAGAQACDTEAYAAWCRGLLARGVYPPASQFEAWFPSLAHEPEHVDRTLEAAAAAFAVVAG
jgi:glutamate-1-semialdehyde aminotransferase